MINCYFDGGYKHRSKTATTGIAVFKNNNLIHKQSNIYNPEDLKGLSSNAAEYAALLNLLNYLLSQNLENESIEIRGDSQLAIQQMQGKRRVIKGAYLSLYQECFKQADKFKNLKFKWIRRTENKLADSLSRRPMEDIVL